MITKPSVCSSGGAGVTRYRRRVDRVFASGDKILDYGTLSVNSEEDLLVQEELRNHEAFAVLGSDALLCLRMMSVFGRGRALVPCGLLKVAAPTQLADNGAAGGIYVAVDMTTGRLAASGSNERLVSFPAPPGVATRFQDFVVPRFDEVLLLVSRAAAVFSDLPVIGWDVAVTEAGPVLIEGNSSPSLAMVIKSHAGAFALRAAMEQLL